MPYVSLCKALYDYEAAAEDELTFTEDTLLYVVDADDAEWWKAKLRTGDDDDDDGPIGLIPANYVEEAEPIRASRALYDYARQNDDEVDITEDEMLSVYESKGDWLLVKRQENGAPIGALGFVPANYVDDVAAVDGITEPMEAAATTIDEPEYIAAGPMAVAPAAPKFNTQAAGNKRASVSAARAVAKDDDIKMWAVSLLDGKKKKKKGTLGIGNSALFFASESDKAPVQKFSVLSIVDHTIEGKGKQLDLELDDEAAAKVETDEKQQLRFVMSSKGDVEEIWAKIEESQRKALQAQEEADEQQHEHQHSNGVSAPPPLPHAARPAASAIPIPPPPPPVATPATILPPPSRAAATPKAAAPAVSAPSPTPELAGGEERAIALYDFEAQGDDELAVSENEALVLVDRETDDWWKVRNAAGQEGVVPASYVEVIAEQPDVKAVTSKASTMKLANERDKSEAQAAREAAARAAAEEERQREDEEAEAERQRQEELEEEAAERARMQEERRANAEAQRRAREAEDRRRQALKAKQPTPAAPRAAPTTSSTSASAASRDISIPSGRSAPARPKEAGSKSKPSPARTRTWHDRSAQFKVEAEFLGFNQGKIRLHKLNGVVIEVAIEKMSQPDIHYLEEVTGRKLAPPRSSRSAAASGTGAAESGGRERERRREQEREQRKRQESARGPKRNVDWFEFFLASGVDIDDCTRYASAFERDKIDESILPELDVETLRKLGLREGDVIRVNKFIQKKYNNKHGSGTATPGGGVAKMSASDQIKADEALARKLQEQEQAARRNGTTPPPNLFSGQDGALKNNTRRGRPTNNIQRNTSGGVDAISLAAVTDSLARTSTPPTRSNTTSPEIIKAQTTSTTTTSGFDDDAWTPRPPSAKPATPAAPAAAVPLPSPAAPVPPTPPPQPPRPTSSASFAAAAVPATSTPEPKPDPNSALFDKLAAMKPSSPSSSMRPGASPLGGSAGLYSGPRGPFAPVAQNQSMLQPLVPTQSTGQFMPTSLGYQPTGMMQAQQTGWPMQAQQTGYMASPMQAHQTGYGGFAGNVGGGGGMQSPFNGMQPQQTGYGMNAFGVGGGVGGVAQQPQPPQQTSQQYAVQQSQQRQQEINSGPERFSAANVFGQMKQGTLHQQTADANAAPQAPQRYDALRPQPTGFQPGGYLNSQYTGFGGGGYGYQ